MTLNRLVERIDAILAQESTRDGKALKMAEAIREEGSYRWVGLYHVDHRVGLVSNIAWSGPNSPAYPTFPLTKGLTSRAERWGMRENLVRSTRYLKPVQPDDRRGTAQPTG